MQDISIQSIKDTPVIDSRNLASVFDHRHRNIFANITKYKKELSEFGRVFFEKAPFETAGGIQEQSFAMLNENQCYFLLTLMRNNETVVKRKMELIKAFSKARQGIIEQGAARSKSKISRLSETSAISKLVDHANENGSKNADMYYMSITKMTNKLLGIESGTRDTLTPEQLTKLSVVEGVVSIAISDGLDKDMHYKEIYQLAKKRCEGVVGTFGIIEHK